MTKLLLMILLLIPVSVHASEAECLASIMYQEGRSESIESVIAIGEASKSRSKRTNKSICKISGVTRKNPPDRLKHYWVTFAKTILNDKKKPTVGDADSFNKGHIPGHNGTITRHIGKHTFYTMSGDLK